MALEYLLKKGQAFKFEEPIFITKVISRLCSNFTLLLKPSTIPEQNSFLALNPLSIGGLCLFVEQASHDAMPLLNLVQCIAKTCLEPHKEWTERACFSPSS